MKIDSVSAYVQMRNDTPLPLYTQAHTLDDLPTFPQLLSY